MIPSLQFLISKVNFILSFNDTIKLDKNYQYDIAGMSSFYKNGRNELWYKNIFTATDNELLTAVSTYFDGLTNWEVSIFKNNVLQTTKSGILPAGYFTIYLDEMIPLKIGDKFEVVFKVSGQENIGVLISEKYYINKLVYKNGTSFISNNGESWSDLYYLSDRYYDAETACIKAFTVLDVLETNLTLNIVYDSYNPVNITATIIDSYGNPVTQGNVTFTFNGKKYVVNVINGSAEITHIFDKTTNNITVVYKGTNYKLQMQQQLLKLEF